jgi:hypothetical protein
LQKQERWLHIVVPLAITLIANIIAVSTLNTAARCKFPISHFTSSPCSNPLSADVAMMLLPGSFYSGSTVLLSWVAGSLTQPAIKRASAIALINAIFNTPNSK